MGLKFVCVRDLTSIQVSASWMIAYIGAQCRHNFPVELFNLTIRLRMEGRSKRIVDIKSPTDLESVSYTHLTLPTIYSV